MDQVNTSPFSTNVREKVVNIHSLVCETVGMIPEDIKKDLDIMETMLINFPRYLPERFFIWLYTKLKDLNLNLDFCMDKHQMVVEKIVLNNYLYGDLSSMDKVIVDYIHTYPKEDSLFYSLLEGETYMRVNVLHPMFLCDQWLVAEYREVKMGPKALSKSLFSLAGVNKKRISPVYKLNTGHTYFFYDKNGYLEKRLALLCEEMKKRGIQCNHEELIDDKYDYHQDTFNDEWWGDYEPTPDALNVNLERLNQRIGIKEDGWYRFWKRPVMDLNDVISTRAQNSFWECPNCKAIHPAPEGDSWVCWKCCSKIPADTPKKSYF